MTGVQFNMLVLLTEALALLSDFVDVDLGRDDCAKLHKQMVEVSIPKVLWEVVDEEVAALRAFLLRGRRLLHAKDVAVGVGGAVLLETRVAMDRAGETEGVRLRLQRLKRSSELVWSLKMQLSSG